MDPNAPQRPVSPLSIRGLVQGAAGAYNGAVNATSQAIESVARPFSRPAGYTPAAAAPPAAVVAPAAVAPAPVAVQPQIGGMNMQVLQRREAAAGLANGGQVGRDTRPARGARRAMPGRGDMPHKPMQHLANGGPVDKNPAGEVQGPGTGTSDSVPAEMPQGTYVMPADTTEEVRLSDGEFKVPPEVVMAAGTAALDAVRSFTHQTVDQAGGEEEAPGFSNGGKICPPGMAKGARRKGYADGGLVTDEDRKSGPSVSTRISQPPAAPGGAAFGVFPQFAGSKQTTYAMDSRLRTGQDAAGNQLTPTGSPQMGLPAGVQPSTAGAGRGSVNPEPAVTAQAPAPAATPALATTPAAATPAAAQVATGMMSGQGSQPGSAGAEASLASEATTGPASTSEQRIATMGRAGQTYRDIAAMQNAGGNAPAVIGVDRAAERNAAFDRETMIQNAARIGGRGASAMLGLVGIGDRARADVTATGMREEGANTRAATHEQGATQREQQRLSAQSQTEAQRMELEGRRVASGEQETAVRVGVGRQQMAEGERMARMRAKLDATTDPAQRRQLQDQILAEQGKTNPNRYTVVPGGSAVDPATGQVVRESSQVLDNQSGTFVSNAAPAAAAAKVTPRAQYDSMPKGSRYVGPDGKTYIKG